MSNIPTIEELLRDAKRAGASDVHITVGIPPKMRVNGQLITMNYDRLLPPDTLQMLDQFMDERQRAMFDRDGEHDMSFSIPNLGRYRVNAYRQRGSVAIALRLVGTQVPSPEVLGVPESVIDLYQRKKGLILVTGPTGSGKSTTLAAIIDKINNNRECHVITLEDPIEYLHQHKKSMVNQREIGLDSQSYANALRAALREDPDVILVGEMRDYETISAAVTAAETGHLVLSTLHTTGAAKTVDRIIDVCPVQAQNQIRIQLAGVLKGVVTQCLVPLIDGGRIAATEVLTGTDAVLSQIREGKTHQLGSVMQSGAAAGMHTLDYDLAKLVSRGLIEKKTALKYAQDKRELEQCIF